MTDYAELRRITEISDQEYEEALSRMRRAYEAGVLFLDDLDRAIRRLLRERDELAKDAARLEELLEAANCCLEFSVAEAFMRHKNQAGVCKEWAILKRQLRAAMSGREKGQ